MGINLRRIVKFGRRPRRDKSWLIPRYEWPAQDPEIDADQLEWQAQQKLEEISANLWRYQQLRLGNKAVVEQADAAAQRMQHRMEGLAGVRLKRTPNARQRTNADKFAKAFKDWGKPTQTALKTRRR